MNPVVEDEPVMPEADGSALGPLTDPASTGRFDPEPGLDIDGFDGFDGFFARHHASMVTALSLALGNDDLGRDAAAEAFAKALARWPKVSRFDNPPGWIFRVGLNWARSRRRKTMREIAETAGRRHEGQTEQVDIDPRVPDALVRLSPDHRAVVVAKFYLDWSEQQTATALDIRPGTVKSRLSRALQQLAVDLGTN